MDYNRYLESGASTADPISNLQAEPSGVAGGNAGQLERAYIPRSFRITEEDVETYGATEACQGCVWLKHKLRPRCGNSESCMKMCETKMEQDACDAFRISRAKARQEDWFAKKVETWDQDEAIIEDKAACKSETVEKERDDVDMSHDEGGENAEDDPIQADIEGPGRLPKDGISLRKKNALNAEE